MLELFYKLIYQKNINYYLRNINFGLKNFFFNKVKIPPSGVLNLKTDSGTLKIETNQTSYLTQLLFWNGYKKFEYSEIFEQLSKKTNIFLDIGSNIGYYSILGVKSNPNMKVYAFEPAFGPKNFLNKNIELNNLSNSIRAFDLALSITLGEIDFYEVESLKYKYINYNLAGEGNAGTKKTSRNFIKNTVKATTLNNFIDINNIENIDLIKIDTEGTEVDILNSGRESIRKFQPIIICETLFNTTENDLEDFFSEIDYDFYNHVGNGLKKVSTIKRNQDNGVRNCFFVPKSKHNYINEFVI
ncbi:FkbM family methyltransferase [Winogradskyella sediminis]|uniref:Methyltransferase, FkbM family n=1 Tax=Winogradskyella sediminis TaxID=1382466 RepID=A0A1H1UC92_9FLAO|nr:FkbM family methyltransferase [Winogradskyella sediminis]SDS70043.1 methyltransferase, FkbM family [Winogradskyella sediminis]